MYCDLDKTFPDMVLDGNDSITVNPNSNKNFSCSLKYVYIISLILMHYPLIPLNISLSANK